MKFLYTLLLLFTLCTPSYSFNDGRYNYVDAQLKEWIDSQYNDKGEYCCNKSDGHEYYGNYSFDKEGNVILDLPEGPHKIEAYKVLKGSNPMGSAIWWHLGGKDYCFAPGTLG